MNDSLGHQQFAALRGLGCDYGRGYLFSRPVSADRVEAGLFSGQFGFELPG